MSIDLTLMKRRLGQWLVLISLALCSSPLLAVNCMPDSIALSSQADVDNFQAVHGPGCDSIVTQLTISGVSITDLTPLSGLTIGARASKILIDGTSLASLEGLSALSSVYWLEINNNNLLSNIDALSNLVSVGGPLFINGNPLLGNVNGLAGLTVMSGGALFLENNASLADLSGISGVTSIGASLVVKNNDALTNLDDLIGLSHVAANINISDNDALTDMSGLSGLVEFNAALYMRNNSMLASIGSLPNLTDIGGLVIWNNNALINLDGLSGVTTIGNQTSLAISYNDVLTNINALVGLVSVGFEVEIIDNPALGQCSSLKTLLDQVDDALSGPGPGEAGIPDVADNVTISGNLAGCNSIDDIVGLVPDGADLSLDVQPAFASLHAGETQGFDLITFNNGPEPATNVFVRAVFNGPVVPETLPTECDFDVGTTTLGCVIPVLANGSGKALSPIMRFPDAGDQSIEVSVEAGETDPNPGNNSASVPVFVDGGSGANLAADVAIAEGANALGQVLVDTEILINAAAANSGPNPATGVTVDVTLPGDWTATSYDPGCSLTTLPAAVRLTCPLANLAAPALPSLPTSAVTQIRAMAASSGTVTVIATAAETDPLPANNFVELPVDVRAFSADLRVRENNKSRPSFLLDDSNFFAEFGGSVASAQDRVTPTIVFRISPAEQVNTVSILWFNSNCVDESTASLVQWRCDSTTTSKYWSTFPRVKFEVDQAGDYTVSARVSDGAAFDPDLANNFIESVVTVLPPPPIRVRAIEVNQVVQDWQNSVELFSGKQTVARVFLEDDEQLRTSTTGKLIGLRTGVPVAGSPLAPINLPIKPDLDAVAKRGFSEWSLNFLLPENWTEEGDLELFFDLDAKGRPADCAEPDSQADCKVGISFTEPVIPELDVVGAGYITDDVQWLIFDCGDPCVVEAEDEDDPDIIKPSGTFKLDVGAQETAAINIADLLGGEPGLLQSALLALPQFDEGEIVVRRLRAKFVGDGQVGWRISIRLQRDWGTFFVVETNLRDATSTISQKLQGGVYQPPPTLGNLFEQVARLKTTLPLAKLDTRLRWIADFDFKPTTYRDINPVLDTYRLLQDSECPSCRTSAMRVGGYLLQGGVEGSGGNAMNRVYSSYISDSVTMEQFGYSRNTGPHEFSHSFGKEHAVVKLNAEGDGSVGLCNAVASETALFHPHTEEIPGLINGGLVLTADFAAEVWPTLGPMGLGPDQEIWGVDARFLTGGTASPIVSPYEAIDVMSYCFVGSGARKWPSDYTYDQVAIGLANGAVGTPDDVGQVGDIVYIAGTIDETDTIDISVVVGARGPMPVQETGDLRVAFVDAGGSEISGVSVPLQAGDGRADLIGDGSDEAPIPAGFTAALPFPGPAVVALVIGDPVAPIARIEASANAPGVEILEPMSGASVPETGLVIRWSASDTDGDDLKSAVFYSVDDGDNWSVLGLNIAGDSIVVPADRLAMSDAALIKVSVTDGIHFAEAISQSFIVQNTAPAVEIMSPPIKNEFETDIVVNRFQSVAWDTEDGSLADDTAEWSSDIDGPLGTGSPLDVVLSTLSRGCHLISVSYTDTQGASGVASQEACVGELILSDGFE